MKWIGAIAAMVIAGLIIYGIIYYGPSIWRGIQDGASDGGVEVLSPSEVREHPNKYLDEEITIEGVYGPITIPSMLDNNLGCIGERFPPQDHISNLVGVESSGIDMELIDGGRYRLKGILMQTSVELGLHLLIFDVPVILVATQAESI